MTQSSIAGEEHGKTFDVVKEEIEKQLRIISDKDFENLEINEDKWIVKGLIPECSICSINGKPATLKTYTALHITFCIATGSPVFGTFTTEKGKVLYINQDNSDGLIKKRIREIKRGLGITGDCDVVFSSLANLKLDNKKELQLLEKYISYTQPKVIVVDCYRRIVSFDENDSQAVSIFLDEIRRLSSKYNLTWIFIHHLRKGFPGKIPSDGMEELRGSSDFAGAGDVILILDRKKDSNNIILKQIKCRHQVEMKPQMIQLNWGEDSLEMTCSGKIEEPLLAEEHCAADIMKYLNENQKISFKTEEIKETMKEHYSESTIKRALKSLKDSGKLLSEIQGHYNVAPAKGSDEAS